MIVSTSSCIPNNPRNPTLQHIFDQVQQRRLRLSEFFKDGDSLRRGMCGHTVFLSVLTQLNISLSAAEISELSTFYHIPSSGMFDYRTFLCDMNDLEVPSRIVELPRRVDSMTTPISEPADPTVVIDKLRQQVHLTRVGIRDYFPDFDPLKKGYCQVSNVKHVFSLLNLHVGEFEALVRRYGNSDGSFQYEAMCADLQTY